MDEAGFWFWLPRITALAHALLTLSIVISIRRIERRLTVHITDTDTWSHRVWRWLSGKFTDRRNVP